MLTVLTASELKMDYIFHGKKSPRIWISNLGPSGLQIMTQLSEEQPSKLQITNPKNFLIKWLYLVPL